MWADPAERAAHAERVSEVRQQIDSPFLRGQVMPSQADLDASEIDVEAFLSYRKAWYDGSIRGMDTEVGRLLARIDELGLRDRVVVAVVGDHGEEFLEHGELGHGNSLYKELVHVPLIVRGPGITPGASSDNLVSTIDLGPTVLSLAGVEIPRHLQGQALLGPRAEPFREYVYASRDRHDTSYDMVRAVRDKRFKYMRNYHPELPYLLWIPYRNRHPIIQEMWRLHAAGELNETQSLMFQSRPAEEFYDTEADPYEIKNLAGDPAYSSALGRLRKALNDWIEDVGDLGEMPESQMVRQWYPDGE